MRMTYLFSALLVGGLAVAGSSLALIEAQEIVASYVNDRANAGIDYAAGSVAGAQGIAEDVAASEGPTPQEIVPTELVDEGLATFITAKMAVEVVAMSASNCVLGEATSYGHEVYLLPNVGTEANLLLGTGARTGECAYGP
ncbi:MAG TPA: hypothetical protein VGR28_00470, partial [Candidatus Thermoplasmatota archaeon]|nr:hypothetical protein [Candidatus Thermoplasmatota archaeon]